ncbi:MAG: GMC oxidoreductase [Thermomicrobiales bacterium]
MMMSGIGEIYDPAAGTGTVGRNYTYQTGGAGLTAWFEDKIMNRFMGSGATQYAMDDFNSDNFDHTGLGFFGGGSITSGTSGARPIDSNGPLPPGSPSWGSEWKAATAQWYNRSMGVGFQGESPAYRQNHLDLDPTYKDAFGQPLLRMTFDYTDNEVKMIEWVGENVHAKLAEALDATTVVVRNTRGTYSIVPYQSTHCQGGTVIASDPTLGPLNKYCQSWDVENVFVVGASNFPQNAGYNPTATVGGLAFWVADAIINKYLPSPGALG